MFEIKNGQEKNSKEPKVGGIGKILLVITITGIFFLMGIIIAINPALILKSVADKYTQEHPREEKAIDKIVSFFDRENKDTDEDQFFSSMTYDEATRKMCDVVDVYLNAAYEKRQQEITEICQKNGYDVELTTQSFVEKGNPFKSVNYASIIATYAVKDTYDKSTLKKFKKELSGCEDDMLSVTYEDAYKEVIIPTPVYKYQRQYLSVNKNTYLKSLPDNDNELKQDRIEVLGEENEEYKEKNKKIDTELQNIEKEYKKGNMIKSSYESMKQSYINKKAENQKKIDENNETISGIRDNRISVSYQYNRKYDGVYVDIEVYTIEKDESGSPVVDFLVSDKNGQECDNYQELFINGQTYYVIRGTVMVYPEVKNIKYGIATMHPFDSSDAFEIFGIEKDGIYAKSYSHDTTNQEQFQVYYRILRELTSIENYSTSTTTHSTTISKEDIQGYLDAMPEGTSLNRKQVVKTALSLTGAIYYQWGGKAANPGWNDSWWQPIGDGYKGLDCSGFVQWSFWTAWNGDLAYQSASGTAGISAAFVHISHNELKPGDVGLKFYGGSNGTQTNHVGIYVGKDASGKDLWVHCTGGKTKTVVVNDYSGFTVYARINSASIDGDNYWTDEITTYGVGATTGLEEDQMTTIAMVMLGECDKDIEGKTAVIEAGCNYANSKGISIFDAFTDGNYVSAYKALLSGQMKKTPTALDYGIINEAVSGTRKVIKDEKVMYWRTHGYSPGNNYVFYGTFGGNDFYKAK